ncbi:hypothetical protein ACOME3_005673 [Neoechinorhynchus agilis]
MTILASQERRHSDDHIARYTTSVLYYASLHQNGLTSLFDCCPQIIIQLVRIMDISMDAVVFFAVTTIHNMLLFEQELKNRRKDYYDIKSTLRKYQAVTKLSFLLKDRQNVKFLAILTDCLQVLSMGDAGSKQDILNSGGINELLRILSTMNYEKLQWTASRLLKVVSVCSGAKKAIIELDGISILLNILRNAINRDERSIASPRVVHNCLYIIRNCSNFATDLEDPSISELIKLIIENLNSTDAIFVQCGVGILCNLTCNNQRNKSLCVQSNGVEALVRALIQSSEENVIEPAVCALRHITSRHVYAQHAQESIRLSYGIPTIVRFISSTSSSALIKATAGLVRNLAVSASNILPLRENGILTRLTSLIKTLIKKSSPRSSHSIIVEACLGALQSLLQSSCSNRVTFRDTEGFDLLSELSVTDTHGVKVQRISLAILNDLVCECRDDQDADTSAIVSNKLAQIPGFLKQLTTVANSDTALTSLAMPILTTMMSNVSSESSKSRSSATTLNRKPSSAVTPPPPPPATEWFDTDL